MDFRQFSAKTVDEAITKACIELGLSSDRLDIQVISEGSSGFLGIGSKPAVIQVREKETAEEKTEGADADATAENKIAEQAEKTAESNSNTIKAETKTTAKSEKENKTAPETGTASVEDKADHKDKPSGEGKDFSQQGKKSHRRHESGRSADKKNGKKPAGTATEDEQSNHAKHEAKPIVDHTDEEIAAMKASAEKFLKEVFAAMEMPVQMSMEYSHEEGSLNIDLEGDDMGILIGKRGQTLDSLQYLVSLVVNREQKNYVRVKLDTEDYRRRRKETLENLAKNIAYKVKRTHRPVSLEAMNPYERRIIHSALQSNRYVDTHSEGNEPYRYVVVTPKKRSDYDEQEQ